MLGRRGILHPARTRLEEIGKVGDTKSITVRRGGVYQTPSRRRKTARVTSVILKTVDPSVEASGLGRCCRHGVCSVGVVSERSCGGDHG